MIALEWLPKQVVSFAVVRKSAVASFSRSGLLSSVDLELGLFRVIRISSDQNAVLVNGIVAVFY